MDRRDKSNSSFSHFFAKAKIRKIQNQNESSAEVECICLRSPTRQCKHPLSTPHTRPQTAGQFIDLWLRQTIREMQEVLYKMIARHFTNHGIHSHCRLSYQNQRIFNFDMLYATQLAEYTRIYINAVVDTVSSDNEVKKLLRRCHCRWKIWEDNIKMILQK